MDEEKDPQAIYKQNVRAWLRDRGLSMKWLASWLGKSEGTVKNWFYGGNPIIEENVDSIDALQVNYHKDNRYHFINPDFDPSPKAYNIPKKQLITRLLFARKGLPHGSLMALFFPLR